MGNGDSEGEESSQIQRKKRKFEGRSRPSQFASLEEYEHPMTDDKKTSGKKPNITKKNKRKASKLETESIQ